MAQLGCVCAVGDFEPFELAQRGATFVDEALLRADLDRRLLDSRSLEWGLTPREAELVWLCSMVLPRERVEQLMSCGHTTFESHLHHARTKMGAATFHEVGRLARA
jgi:DNA-binding CsgD family transcriptional regulator